MEGEGGRKEGKYGVTGLEESREEERKEKV